MKKLFTLLLLVLFVCSVQAQRPTGVIKKATTAPVIDGDMEAVWDDANVFSINLPFAAETPTVGADGETNWRALWDADGMYIFVTVKDDIWFPVFAGTGDEWTFDKVEIYFDVNYLLEDGLGAMSGKGHYQVAPPPAADIIDGTPTVWDTNVTWAYLVNDPDYTLEVFVPWTYLKADGGAAFDKTAEMGFDVGVTDRDSQDGTRNRMVWANNTEPESWANLDGAGYVTFEGAEANTLIDEITITGDNTITKNKGSVQLTANVLPADATEKTLAWSIKNTVGQTGRATVDNTGRVKAIADGEITVEANALDGSYEWATHVITISNQKPTRWDYNLIRNGFFNHVNSDGSPAEWGGWIGDNTGADYQVVDGEAVLDVTTIGMDGENPVAWKYQFNQVNLTAEPDIPYVLSFVAYASEDRVAIVDFEDTADNGHNRYGASGDPNAAGGRSEWTFDLTTEPQLFTFNVTFDQIVPTTIQKVQFMLSQAVGTVFIDSVLLISTAELAASFPDDTYAMYTVNFGVVEVDGATNGTITAVVEDAAITSGDDVQEQKDVVFTAVPDAGYIVKQWTNRGVVIDGVTENTYTATTYDELDIMVEFELGTSVEDNLLSKLKVYPNPFNNTIYISNTESVKRVSVTNIVGQRILEMELNGESTIDTGSFNSGVYFMIFEGIKGERMVHKMIKR